MVVMLLVTALAPFVVLATRVVADPFLTRDYPLPSLSISRHVNAAGTYHPVQRDKRRFKHLMNKNKGTNTRLGSSTSNDTADDVPINTTGINYVASVGIGVPPTYYSLIVDTGSSNTWVGANAPYVRTNASVNTSDAMVVNYGTANFVGRLINDTVTLAPGLAVQQQPIGVASNSSGISPSDGILGIGPSDLTFGTLYPHNTSIVPTVTDSLFAQGTIKQNLVAISFEPTISEFVVNGELTFGATDPTKYIGEIDYSPITKNTTVGVYWGIDASIRYGGTDRRTSLSLAESTAGYVDTGTTLIYLSTAAYKQYAIATGGLLDNSTRLLRINNAQYENLRPLYFEIGNSTFELTPNAQIWPRKLNSAINGNPNSVYLIVQDIGQMYPGVDFICGMAFLERYYSVFDTGNRRVGFARTPFTNATTN